MDSIDVLVVVFKVRQMQFIWLDSNDRSYRNVSDAFIFCNASSKRTVFPMNLRKILDQARLHAVPISIPERCRSGEPWTWELCQGMKV